MKKLEFHPLLKNVPMMPFHERDALATDIEKHGQVLPVVTWQGKIIDGRNRYLACLSRNIEPKMIEFGKSNAGAHITSLNYFRKHWTTTERAHFAALMSLESEVGNPAAKDADALIAPNGAIPSVSPVITQDEAAKQMGVSRRSVQRAKNEITGKSDNKTTSEISKQQGLGGNVQDANGTEIPKAALPYWNRKAEAKNVLNQIAAARGQIKKLMPDDPMWANVNLNGVIADLNSAFNRFTAAIPAYVCPYCKGVKVEGCKCCKGKGVVSKFVWSTIPEEI